MATRPSGAILRARARTLPLGRSRVRPVRGDRGRGHRAPPPPPAPLGARAGRLRDGAAPRGGSRPGSGEVGARVPRPPLDRGARGTRQAVPARARAAPGFRRRVVGARAGAPPRRRARRPGPAGRLPAPRSGRPPYGGSSRAVRERAHVDLLGDEEVEHRAVDRARAPPRRRGSRAPGRPARRVCRAGRAPRARRRCR